MAACVLCKEINELFLKSLVELLFGRASQFTERWRHLTCCNEPNCFYGLRLRLFAEWWRHGTDSGAKQAKARKRQGRTRELESIAKPRLSTGSEFCIFNRFPSGHYLVWWVMVRVRVSLGVRVRVRVRVNNLLGSR